MTRLRFIGALALVPLAACGGLKDAFSSHVDVAARAGSQELSVSELATLLGNSRVPVRKEVAQSIVDAWVNYQLLGTAAAAGDSLNDDKLIDDAMWSAYTSGKTTKFYKKVSEAWVIDTSDAAAAAAYDKGDLLSASHILFQVPQGAEGDTVALMKKAQGVLDRANAGNFAALAKQYGSDGTKDVGGDLGVFPPNQMVPEFSKGVQALKPGEIGPLVRTQFGYHIVRRSTFADAKPQFMAEFVKRQRFVAESTYITGLEQDGKIDVKETAAKTVKDVAASPAEHADDKTVVATSRLGNFTAANVARWINGFPQPEQIRGQIAQAPDSLMKTFVLNLMRNELILDAANKEKVTMDSAETAEIRNAFKSLVGPAWSGLGIEPGSLSDSAKTKAEKERVAAGRINAYLAKLVDGEAQFVEVPAPLAHALQKKYDWKINSAALDKAVADAQPIRAKADSTRAAQTPPSAVPVPGAMPPADTSAR
ncbi:MAG: peptidylprolyl isomerase [Gemmatimonadetes bacterium]|nr:peptidylprolyl isomerase [Gemmatimonadota bacterium]